MQNETSARCADHPIDEMFVRRWSPRAFTGEPIPEEILAQCLEAARWAPSAFNAQPWRFAIARRDGPHWVRFLDLLLPFNQAWAQHASALLFLASETHQIDQKSGVASPSRTHSFDAGAAWACFALQASLLGWAAHAMAGFDVERAAADLGGAKLRVEAAIAIGRPGNVDRLPERLRAREQPSLREAVERFSAQGAFPAAQ